ncbi:hypothetical protein GCM10009655_26590 [Rhodoglobus aureus]|uniref:Uncharacterized protein n=1 Tax=Rhodoglobus aureus TaxID=191497 RepID=A0ABN1VYH5_9MICO
MGHLVVDSSAAEEHTPDHQAGTAPTTPAPRGLPHRKARTYLTNIETSLNYNEK